MRPDSYHDQHACRNCVHSWRYLDYDGAGYWYCTNSDEPRPLCGSVAMGEWRTEMDDGFDVAAWELWAIHHFVNASGICDGYKERLPQEYSPESGEGQGVS